MALRGELAGISIEWTEFTSHAGFANEIENQVPTLGFEIIIIIIIMYTYTRVLFSPSSYY